MSTVTTQDSGHVRHVILSRAEKRNAMNAQLVLDLHEALRETAGDPDVHCVVVRGEGPVFSAGIDLGDLAGKLIVVEGADGSGRSTQIVKLVEWLEGCGHATVQVGLKRSTLVSEELEQAQEGNILSRTTLSLFYATDFADQLENIILPALKAGFIVLADRYIYTLMARDMVRGMDQIWLKNLYGIAPEPDAVFYLKVPPDELVQRTFAKKSSLDYWES